jgi:hypothetical protein
MSIYGFATGLCGSKVRLLKKPAIVKTSMKGNNTNYSKYSKNMNIFLMEE